MRKLKSTDIFAACRVVKELGIKEEMKEFAKSLQTGKITANNQEQLGLQLIVGIIGDAGTESAEKAIYKFLSAPMEIPVEELMDMEALEFCEKIKEFIRMVGIEEWKAFFTSVWQMRKSQE